MSSGVTSMAAEIERLRKERDWAWGKGYESAKAERTATIEECARVVVARANKSHDPIELLRAASAIGALKDKT